MGLDLLDIQFRIEKTFGVKLSNEDYTALMRNGDILVGDLYNLLLKKMQLYDTARYDIPLNFRLWEEIQRVLQSVTGVPLERIELKTRLDALFPRQTRRAAWETLRDACPYRLGKLDYPGVVRGAGFGLAAGMVVVEQFPIWQMAGVNWLWPVLGILGIWMVSETYLKMLWICAPLRNRFPSRMATVKDLCRAVLATNYEEICRNTEIPLDDRCLVVWRQLTEILVAALGIDADAITFHSRMFRDLGAA